MKRLRNPIRTLAIAFFCFVVLFSVTVTAIARVKYSGKLPDAIEISIQKLFPGAQIQEVDRHRRMIQLIEVTVVHDDRELDLTLSQDGTLLSIAHDLDVDRLPTAAQYAVQRVAGTAKIREAEQKTVLAEIRAIALEEPRIQYEAEFRSNGREQEVTVLENGTLLTTPNRLRLENDD